MWRIFQDMIGRIRTVRTARGFEQEDSGTMFVRGTLIIRAGAGLVVIGFQSGGVRPYPV